MDLELTNLLTELELFGVVNDRQNDNRLRRMLNITHDTGELLGVLVRAANARRVLEIGTSNGYSTLWLAEAARANEGLVTTVEFSEYKVDLARANFARSRLDHWITLVHIDAGLFLANALDDVFDLIFLDSERAQYIGWWAELRRVLKPGGLLVVDNATSHRESMEPFLALVRADPDFTTCLVPTGNGEFMAVRNHLSKT